MPPSIKKTVAAALAQLAAPGNIPLDSRQVVLNEDGSFSTEESLSFQDENGFEVLIPTVFDGRHHTPEEAIDHYYQTGQQLGVFTNPMAAEVYAQKLHQAQERRYEPVARALLSSVTSQTGKR
jgi:hypothetical protein